MLLYYITDRMEFAGDERSRCRLVLDKIGEAAACGVDLIQLREKDLTIRQLEDLACEAARVVQKNSGGKTRLLINSRCDVALASAADGVHLRSDDISPRDARAVWSRGATPAIAVSCHSLSGVERAKNEGAEFAVFGPVFEKKNSRPAGLVLLHQACGLGIRVLALGGVTVQNARACVDAGAAGIAAIRLFQENEIADVVRRVAGPAV